MTTQADVQAQWEALTAAAHTDQPLTEPMQTIATVLEQAGLKVTILDGVVYADDTDVDPATGVADCRASFRITQEA